VRRQSTRRWRRVAARREAAPAARRGGGIRRGSVVAELGGAGSAVAARCSAAEARDLHPAPADTLRSSIGGLCRSSTTLPGM
jgi:hypothetical protein